MQSCEEMASNNLVVLFSEGDEESCDELASKYALGQCKTNRDHRTKYVWTVDMICALIQLWAKAPLLYDSKDLLYFNKLEREKAIGNIAKELGITINDVLGKMYSLRTYYSKQQGMIQASLDRGTEDVYKPRWQWYESLSFLSDHMRSKPGNISQINRRPVAAKDSAKESIATKTLPDRLTRKAQQQQQQQHRPEPIKKIRLNSEEPEITTEISVVKQVPVLKKTSHTSQDKSEDMLWAEQMGRSIEKIQDEELKEWLKLEIQQMIIRTRFKKPRGSFSTEFNSSRVSYQSVNVNSLPSFTADSETSGNED